MINRKEKVQFSIILFKHIHIIEYSPGSTDVPSSGKPWSLFNMSESLCHRNKLPDRRRPPITWPGRIGTDSQGLFSDTCLTNSLCWIQWLVSSYHVNFQTTASLIPSWVTVLESVTCAQLSCSFSDPCRTNSIIGHCAGVSDLCPVVIVTFRHLPH